MASLVPPPSSVISNGQQLLYRHVLLQVRSRATFGSRTKCLCWWQTDLGWYFIHAPESVRLASHIKRHRPRRFEPALEWSPKSSNRCLITRQRSIGRFPSIDYSGLTSQNTPRFSLTRKVN